MHRQASRHCIADLKRGKRHSLITIALMSDTHNNRILAGWYWRGVKWLRYSFLSVQEKSGDDAF